MPGKFDINPQTGKQYGINPATGVQDDNYWANVVEPSLGGSSGGGGAGNVVDIAKQMYELANQFRQPAIQTLQGTRAGIEPAYAGLKTAAEAQKPTLEARYQSLLTDITKGTREAAAKEYTQRGIPLSSGIVEQTVGSRLAPQIQAAGVQREAGISDINTLLANLGMGQQGAYQNLDQAIAALQSASGPEAITAAQNIYQQQQQSQQQAAQLALQQLQQQQTAAYQQQQLGFQQQQATWEQPWQEKLWQYQLNQPYYKPSATTGAIPPFPEF